MCVSVQLSCLYVWLPVLLYWCYFNFGIRINLNWRLLVGCSIYGSYLKLNMKIVLKMKGALMPINTFTENKKNAILFRVSCIFFK